MLYTPTGRFKMPSELEIERKFAIKPDEAEKLKSNCEREGIAQWYTQNSRIRLKVNINGEAWIKEEKKAISYEKRTERKTFTIDEDEILNLKKFPVVIKWRYYFDEEKKVSLDEYLYPEFEYILEIELNDQEVKKYLSIENSNLSQSQKAKEKDKIFEKKIQNLPLRYRDIVKNEKTKDERYYNFNIAKMIEKVPNFSTKGDLEKVFYKRLCEIITPPR